MSGFRLGRRSSEGDWREKTVTMCRGPPDWIDADEQLFLDEDLDQDRYEIDKSSGQKICTAESCPYGWRTGTCAMNSING
jgi:hypothetical protein